MRHTELLRQKGEHLIPAVAYGDAAGLPVETRSAQEIADRYGRIDRLVPTTDNPYFSDKPAPGFWSDDTQLSIAVAEGLRAANHFALDALATAHLRAYEETPVILNSRGVETKQGWGGSTVAAMEQLRAGTSPLESGTPEGAGNGVLMKLAPLVYWQYVRGTTLAQRTLEYDQLTTMTHDSDIARAATRIHGEVLHSLLCEGFSEQTFQNAVEACDLSIESSAAFSSLFAYLNNAVDSDTILQQTDGKGFYAPQTLAMAYGAFQSQEGRFTESVYEAVNLGGDTDSTASIVAAMSVFATRTMIDFPSDFETLDQFALLQQISKDFTDQAFS